MTPEGRAPDLAARIAAGEPRALARGISWVEDEHPGFEELLDALHGRVGRARRIGITGPPGAGKSTLTAALARGWLDEGLEVGVVAVDPTSPFTGGALLGDRIRMTELATEPGIFIRSMASRGSVGGLATATREAADLMDAAGFDRVILETVGVGQSELDIAASADTTVVVLVPESGDGIQAMKAGLMEVADLFVVNKADRPGADRLEKEIAVMMAIRRGQALRGIPSHHHGRPTGALVARSGAGRGDSGGTESEGEGVAPWEIPVLRTSASSGEGLERLRDVLDDHAGWLRQTDELGRRRAAQRLRRAYDVLLRRARREAERAWREGEETARRRLEAGESPYAIAARLHEATAVAERGA